ncbi:winged helix-turn-helix domain-containing protein [Providencia sneebia]|uniref:OmpR/PhoB-type domain-containing protein n=1 Tax=Providencia sneebia DSM 19967 TaxID=1141660 RepID=K8WJE9_9GAMM|nr:winged helix-turn-helix domain-containing protein [Providencia sneebia]EKT60091.1 hypothetical protein OO7_04669 [Providencia sneebia DSM 19967]
MKYIINHQITFSNEDRTLSLLNDIENTIVLSAPASRLLLTLIINKNVPLTREYLLKTVWVEYGFTASGSNLNNYISELRKSLTYLDANFMGIITIPKVGFQFTAHIETSISEKNNLDNLDTLHASLSILAPHDDKEKNKNDTDNPNVKSSITNRKNSGHYKFFIEKNNISIIMFSIPLIIIFIFTFIIPHHKIKNENSRFIFSTGNCNIYLLDDFSTLSNEEIITKVEKN